MAITLVKAPERILPGHTPKFIVGLKIALKILQDEVKNIEILLKLPNNKHNPPAFGQKGPELASLVAQHESENYRS